MNSKKAYNNIESYIRSLPNSSCKIPNCGCQNSPITVLSASGLFDVKRDGTNEFALMFITTNYEVRKFAFLQDGIPDIPIVELFREFDKRHPGEIVNFINVKITMKRVGSVL